jgi:hypothetical protein
MHYLYIHIKAFLTGKRIILLHSVNGAVSLSLEHKTPFGESISYVNEFYKIGSVILLDNGKLSKKSDAAYIDEWKYKYNNELK